MAIMKQVIPLMQFSTGQRLRILHRLRELAGERGFGEILPLIDRAIEHEQRTRALENHWAGRTGRSLYADQVVDIDGIVDQLLGGIRDIARGHARGLPAYDPVTRMCEHFLTEVFPNGLQAIVSLPYVDQVAAVEVIVGKLNGELADTVRQLGLEQKRDRLAELTVEYRRLVDEGRRDLRFADIREARERGQQLLREVIVVVLGRFHDSTDPDQLAVREALLAPLLVQLDETRARARARRRNRIDEPDPNGPGEAPAGDVDDDDADVEAVNEDVADEGDDGDDDDLAGGVDAGPSEGRPVA